MIERTTDNAGRVITRVVQPDDQREIVAVQVVSLSPPTVRAPGGRTFPVGARAVGLTVEVGDWVAAFRTVQVGVVALAKLEVI